MMTTWGKQKGHAVIAVTGLILGGLLVSTLLSSKTSSASGAFEVARRAVRPNSGASATKPSQHTRAKSVDFGYISAERATSRTGAPGQSISTAGANARRTTAATTDGAASRVLITTVTTDTFDDQVLRSSVPVLVDFYADWCGPCRIQARILQEFAAEAKNLKIVKVDVDQNAELAERFQVEALPTLLIIKDGEVVVRHMGVTTKEQLKSLLTRY